MRTGRRAGSRTSSFSDEGNGCVAVDFIADALTGAPTHVEIEHSKVVDGPVITFTVDQWLCWLDEVQASAFTDANGAVTVKVEPGAWVVTDRDGAALVFNELEWTAFRRGVAGGEFDPEAAVAALTAS